MRPGSGRTATEGELATPPRGLSLSPRRAAFWVGWTALFVFAAVTNACSWRSDFARYGIAVDPRLPFLWEATSAVATLALLPALVWLVDRWPWSRGITAGLVSRYVLAALGFSVLHVAGMVALRKIAYALEGSTYDFGPWLRELVYELRKDAVTFVLLSAVLNLMREVERRIAAPVIAPAGEAGLAAGPSPTAASTLRIRDGSGEVELDAARVVAVRAAGNYVEIFGVRERPLLMRATLAEVEERLAPLGIRRVHRSWLVALHHLEGVTTTGSGDFTLALPGGLQAPASRRHRSVIEPYRGRSPGSMPTPTAEPPPPTVAA